MNGGMFKCSFTKLAQRYFLPLFRHLPLKRGMVLVKCAPSNFLSSPSLPRLTARRDTRYLLNLGTMIHWREHSDKTAAIFLSVSLIISETAEHSTKFKSNFTIFLKQSYAKMVDLIVNFICSSRTQTTDTRSASTASRGGNPSETHKESPWFSPPWGPQLLCWKSVVFYSTDLLNQIIFNMNWVFLLTIQFRGLPKFLYFVPFVVKKLNL